MRNAIRSSESSIRRLRGCSEIFGNLLASFPVLTKCKCAYVMNLTREPLVRVYLTAGKLVLKNSATLCRAGHYFLCLKVAIINVMAERGIITKVNKSLHVTIVPASFLSCRSKFCFNTNGIFCHDIPVYFKNFIRFFLAPLKNFPVSCIL